MSGPYDAPDWLVKRSVEASKKAGLPLNWLANEMKKLDQSGEADPFKRSREKQRQTALDTERRTEAPDWRQLKIDKRSFPTNYTSAVDTSTTSPIAESSKDATSRPPMAGHRPSSDRLPLATTLDGSASLSVPDDMDSYDPDPKNLPRWYTSITLASRQMKELSKRPSPQHGQALTALSSMKTCMDRCEAANRTQLSKLFDELRDQLHKAEITLKVDQYVVRKAKMLDAEYGLPRIFNGKNRGSKVTYPWDLKADAWQLYSRWANHIFEVDLMRGIKVRPGKERNADSIDPAWKNRYPARFYGEGHLILGQWWPTQLCAVRDGAHGAPQGGIFGEKAKGAYSIVMSGAGNSQYDDEDNGEEVWYSGTDGSNFTPTESTQRLIESCDVIKRPVRVLRSHQLPKKNQYRPEVGLRYDGLYWVVDKRLVDPKKQKYKFRLVRCENQHPIRHEDTPARRPTVYEIIEFEKLKKFGY